ncbi:hypothetical protein, partial [uncultured Rikenella sp.]|uniref:hypothetical protein n=1 Tax=uncultured Rikenella sp. TaxID=368003 RepID=UPI0025F57369
HCGSAAAPPVPLGTRKMGVSTPKRRPRQFLPDWPSANRQNMPFKRAGDGFFAQERVCSRAILCPRAWGNLVKTRKRILTISLLRRGARLV